jgi:hypothetical protein
VTAQVTSAALLLLLSILNDDDNDNNYQVPFLIMRLTGQSAIPRHVKVIIEAQSINQPINPFTQHLRSRR